MYPCLLYQVALFGIKSYTTIFLFAHPVTLKLRGVPRGMNMRDRHLNSWDRRVLFN
jgi:hypothetical protein